MNTSNPSSEKVFEFVAKLEAVAQPFQKCDMTFVGVHKGCVTPGCHGAWAAIAILGNAATVFNEGADALTQFLGMEDYLAKPKFLYDSLRKWAYDNPKLWGNSRGAEMFSKGRAFMQRTNAFPVSVLIDHWREVGERLKALEESR